MTKSGSAFSQGILGKFLQNKDVRICRGAVRGLYLSYKGDVDIGLALSCFIPFYSSMQLYYHTSSLKRIPPIITGSPKRSFKNTLNCLFYCRRSAAALKMAFLFAFLCGQVGHSFMAADAAAIKGNALRSKLNNFVYIGVNIFKLLF